MWNVKTFRGVHRKSDMTNFMNDKNLTPLDIKIIFDTDSITLFYYKK